MVISDTVECPVCGDEFDGEGPMEQHRKAKHSSQSTPDDSSGYEAIRTFGGNVIYGGGALAIAYMLVYWVIPWMGQPGELKMPSPGDHWHARYEIVLCGEKIPQRPRSQGDIHTHGNGRIHIHPKSRATAGKRANLGAFFESFDARLTDEKISIPMVGTYENGDQCDGEPGEVAVYVNGERITDPAEYVPQDMDVIRFTFES